MNLIVLVKQVPDVEREIKFKDDLTLDRKNIESMINPYDKNAIEAALNIREKYGGKIVAISMGASDKALREAVAMGIFVDPKQKKDNLDEAILLNDERFIASDTVATSYILSQAIKKFQYDLILCGMHSIDGETGQVGPFIAERLGIPQLTYVEEIKINEDKTIEVKRILEGGYQKVKAKYPALITVTNTLNEPRYPNLKNKMVSTKTQMIKVWKAEDIDADAKQIGKDGSLIKTVGISKVEPRKIECKELKMEELVKELKKERVI